MRDHEFILTLERDLENFVLDTSKFFIQFPSTLNTYQRLIVHKLSDHFLLGHIFDSDRQSLIVSKKSASRIPSIMYRTVVSSPNELLSYYHKASNQQQENMSHINITNNNNKINQPIIFQQPAISNPNRTPSPQYSQRSNPQHSYSLQQQSMYPPTQGRSQNINNYAIRRPPPGIPVYIFRF